MSDKNIVESPWPGESELRNDKYNTPNQLKNFLLNATLAV